MAWGSGTVTNAWTGSSTSTTGNTKQRDSVSSNPWSAALKAQYDAAKTAQNTYKPKWDSAVSTAEGLNGKDYTAELRRMAGEDVTQEQTTQNNQLGALGMRELALKKDVTDDWAKRRSDASSKAAINAQAMQISALGALTSTLSGASTAELNTISQALAAATAGASADQNWTSMQNNAFESDRAFSKTITDETKADQQALAADAKARNAAELAAWQTRQNAKRAADSAVSMKASDYLKNKKK